MISYMELLANLAAQEDLLRQLYPNTHVEIKEGILSGRLTACDIKDALVQQNKVPLSAIDKIIRNLQFHNQPVLEQHEGFLTYTVYAFYRGLIYRLNYEKTDEGDVSLHELSIVHNGVAIVTYQYNYVDNEGLGINNMTLNNNTNEGYLDNLDNQDINLNIHIWSDIPEYIRKVHRQMLTELDGL